MVAVLPADGEADPSGDVATLGQSDKIERTIDISDRPLRA
jgi:hypothetical protein